MWQRDVMLSGGQDLPSGAGEQAVDERGFEGGRLELLNERRLVKGDAGGECLGDDALTLGDELGGESGAQCQYRVRVWGRNRRKAYFRIKYLLVDRAGCNGASCGTSASTGTSSNSGLPALTRGRAGAWQGLARWTMGAGMTRGALAVVVSHGFRGQIALVHALCAVAAGRAASFVDALCLALATAHAGAPRAEGGAADDARGRHGRHVPLDETGFLAKSCAGKR